jgi:alpha-tubulin suppressor-like RCC1 family protein
MTFSRFFKAICVSSVVVSTMVALPLTAASTQAASGVRDIRQTVSVQTSGWTNTNVVAVDAGMSGGCAIQGATLGATSGELYCWGSATVLGTGASTESDVPVKVSTGNGFSNSAVTAVAVGDDHACAVESGMMWCWGQTYAHQTYGILGTGATASLTPVKVTANDGFDNDGASGDVVTAIGATFARTCAIEGGQVFCWGSNNAYQVGVGPSGSATYNIPQRVVDTNPTEFQAAAATELSVGFNHSCAIASASIYCWGVNGQGNLGDGSTTSRSVPVKVAQGAFASANSGITDLGLGDSHSCAIQSGKVRCWGAGANSRLGDGATADQSAPVDVVAGGGLLNSTAVTDVSGGEKHTCAVESGKLYCWGANESGQLGNGTTTASATPVAVAASDGFLNSGNVTAVSASAGGGYGHTCAIESGSVYCWGATMDERLGVGETFGPQTTPAKVFVATAPAAPTISVMGGMSGSLSVYVTKPNDGGSTITAYEYQVDSGSITSVAFSSNYQGITLTGLTNGTQYSIKVRAVNGVGTGPWSTAATGTPSSSGGGGGTTTTTPGSGGGGGGGGYTPPPVLDPAPLYSVGEADGGLLVCVDVNGSEANFVSVNVHPADFEFPEQGPADGFLLPRNSISYSDPEVPGRDEMGPMVMTDWSGGDIGALFGAMTYAPYSSDGPADPADYVDEPFEVGASYEVSMYAAVWED